MPLQLSNELGKVYIAEEVIASLAGNAALECYGLVGMASRKQLKDGLYELLGRENLGKGIVVKQENGKIGLDLHIVVSYGTKISEVAHNIQTKVRFVLNDVLGLQIDRINIIVQGVRV